MIKTERHFMIWYFAFFIGALFLRLSDGLFLSQLGNQPITSPRLDPFVWIIESLNIRYLLDIKYVRALLDFLVCLFPFVAIWKLWKRQKISTVALCHFFIFFIYILAIYTFPTLSIRKYLGLVIIPLAFIFTSNFRRKSFLELVRYYVCFIFVSASSWKIFRGSVFDPNHMITTLRRQHTESVVHFPDHIVSELAQFLILHPLLCYTTFLAAVVTQLAFLLGFFTKRFDKILAFLLIIFVLTDYLVMRIEYWEFLVFLPLFWYKIDNWFSEEVKDQFGS